MKKTIAHEDYVKACLLVESLINQVDDDMGEDHSLMKEFLAASDIIEQYEEAHYPIGLPALADVIRLRMEEMRLRKHDISVEEMVKLQKYQGIDAETFDRITTELDIHESLDELLKSV